ncbi:hypothetical protein AQI88_31115 [Streptomyces cellostaticus]|uniref:Ricin B lectin domain-containing protein n=1 Tax=Streptomyces cellostaticus TaxID=67285 RepID=A0A117PUN3_9ACTN|nr:RICIN domain-containing protein [Streptomyces cellostaticus]KUM92616.1 hypothetical protein AQI88_31115 [Streptomyces cellostaticus]GHI10526.1 hypothetical protein Scel_88470 [Streptomyces cellostaticus]
MRHLRREHPGQRRPRLLEAGSRHQCRAHHSGTYLDVEWASHADTARIVQANCHYGDNQRWYQQPTSDGYVLLIAKHSGKCMDVAWADEGDGAPVVQSGCWHGNNQQFKLAPV